MKSKNVIILSLFPVDFKTKMGGQARLVALLKELRSNGFNPHHICVYGTNIEPRTREIFKGINETWIPSIENKGRNFLLKSYTKFSNDSETGILLHNYMMLVNFIRQILTENSYIIATHFWFGELKKHFPEIPFMLFSHNFESDLISIRNFEPKFISFYKAREASGCRFFDQIFCCSNSDLENFKKISKDQTKLTICSNGTYLKASTKKNQFSQDCLYIGSHWYPNEFGLKKLISNCPEFLKHFKIHLVGSICKTIKINHKNIVLHNVLMEKDLKNVASQCSFAINPVWFGGGSNVKNADYLGLGLPILTTEFGKRGFEIYSKYITILPVKEWGEFRKFDLVVDDKTIEKVQWPSCLKKLFLSLEKVTNLKNQLK
ncbi:hypothetical protein N9P07_05535 [Alphaproteobacteria bacterium]|nr:hypothetical protein [Alphaproteobacteria bacterium]